VPCCNSITAQTATATATSSQKPDTTSPRPPGNEAARPLSVYDIRHPLGYPSNWREDGRGTMGCARYRNVVPLPPSLRAGKCKCEGRNLKSSTTDATMPWGTAFRKRLRFSAGLGEADWAGLDGADTYNPMDYRAEVYCTSYIQCTTVWSSYLRPPKPLPSPSLPPLRRRLLSQMGNIARDALLCCRPPIARSFGGQRESETQSNHAAPGRHLLRRAAADVCAASSTYDIQYCCQERRES
jgi:hypothetical protein